MSTSNLHKRVAMLEEKTKPQRRVISTLADLVTWAADYEDGDKDVDVDVELSPEMENFVNETLERIEAKDESLSL